MTKLESLKKEYFKKMEQVGKKATGYETVFEMCQALNMPLFVIEWTLDLIAEEMKEELAQLERAE